MSMANEAARELAAMRKREKKVCEWCGEEFVAIKKAKYCSPAHARAAYWERNRARLNARRMELYYQRKEQERRPDSSEEGEKAK
jgi:hypothetical protein